MIDNDISKKTVIIGPYHKNRKGGMAMVINNLSGYYNPFYFIPSTRSKRSLASFLYFGLSIFRLLYYILIKRIRIVHIHGASYGSFVRKMILINIAYCFNAKIIYHIHSGEYKSFYAKYNKKGIISKTLHKVDKLVVLSQEWKQFFSTIIDRNKIIIVNNIIKRPTALKANTSDRECIWFLFLGEIGDKKGIFDLMDVIIKNKKAWEGHFILHVGGNGETTKLKEIIKREELHNIVRFEGWVDAQKKENLLISSDVLILPSYNEGLPVAILEAMSYGKAILSTYVGGIPDIIQDHKNGLLIMPGDKEALESKIEYILANRAEIKTMGNLNLEIIERFYPEYVIPQLNTLYKELLNTK